MAIRDLGWYERESERYNPAKRASDNPTVAAVEKLYEEFIAQFPTQTVVKERILSYLETHVKRSTKPYSWYVQEIEKYNPASKKSTERTLYEIKALYEQLPAQSQILKTRLKYYLKEHLDAAERPLTPVISITSRVGNVLTGEVCDPWEPFEKILNE